MRRAAVLLIALALCAAPSPALAQSSPFGPLPQAVEPTPPPPPVQNPADRSRVDRTLLLGIAGVVAVLFLFMGWFISRDARRNLTEADRRAVERSEHPPQTDKQRSDALKKKARAKARAQKQARKKQQARKKGRR